MKRLVERLRYQALQSDGPGEDRGHKQRIKHAVKSYHGAVIENLDTDPEYYVAVETIAANKYRLRIFLFLSLMNNTCKIYWTFSAIPVFLYSLPIIQLNISSYFSELFIFIAQQSSLRSLN